MTRFCVRNARRRELLLASVASLVAFASVRTRGASIAIRHERPVRVRLDTSAGPIDISVDVDRAPQSAGDFLRYVDQGRFAGGAFYRVVRSGNDTSSVPISVIQGGVRDPTGSLPPVAHEPTSVTGLRHTDGVISLARDAPGTGSASAFFICIGDQPELDFGGRRQPDRQGFAAFGRVTHGMPIVKRIWQMTVRAADVLDPMVGQQLVVPVHFRSIGRL